MDLVALDPPDEVAAHQGCCHVSMLPEGHLHNNIHAVRGEDPQNKDTILDGDMHIALIMLTSHRQHA